MKLRTIFGAAVLSIALTGAVNAATVLNINTGWQYGEATGQGVKGGEVFSVDVTDAAGAVFSLTDGFLPGDTFTIVSKSGPFAITNTSTFTSYPTPFVNNEGPASYFASDWTSSSFSHFQEDLSQGLYTVTVYDTANVGYPAGFGVRLDTAVPEPATWALMLIGFGAMGFAMRRRQQRYVSFA